MTRADWAMDRCHTLTAENKQLRADLAAERAAREALAVALADCEEVIGGLIKVMAGEDLIPGEKTLAALAAARAALAAAGREPHES